MRKVLRMLGKIFTGTLILLGLSLPLHAQLSLPSYQELETAEPFFKVNYLTLELVKNQSYGESQKRFDSGKNSVFVGFRHILRDHWLMGVHTGFKKLRSREDGKSISVFTILQETQLLYRINHPLYLSFGPKLLYLLPTLGNKIPPQTDKRYNRESGVGICLALHYALAPNVFMSMRIDRWRGVNTQIFQGTESAFGLNVALP